MYDRCISVLRSTSSIRSVTGSTGPGAESSGVSTTPSFESLVVSSVGSSGPSMGGCSLTGSPYRKRRGKRRTGRMSCAAWLGLAGAPEPAEARMVCCARHTCGPTDERQDEAYGSDVKEADVAGVALDEPTPGLDVLPHENGEDLVRRGGVGQ